MSEDRKSGRSKRARAVVDRVEDGGVAVLLVGEEELKVELPASLLPEGAEGGSHLLLNVSLDEDSRRAAEDRVRALQEKLEGRAGDGGRKDFKL